MSLLNHPNLVSCYCSFVSSAVRRLCRCGGAHAAGGCLLAAPGPVGHHAILFWRLNPEHHEVGPSAGVHRPSPALRCALMFP